MDLEAVLSRIAERIDGETDRGEVARYIPELASIDPAHFGMSVVLANGNEFSTGEADLPFSIQSISKIFSLAIALGTLGDQLWERVGREPSGQAFDSILQLEHEGGRPRNPFINAGAIVTTDSLLVSSTPRETLGSILRFVRSAADDPDIHINQAVAKSEIKSGHRNFALAHYMQSCGNLKNEPALTLGTYFHQCAIEMSCRQLARAGRFLVSAPKLPKLVSPQRVRRINALMMTCGHYDGSGDFAFRIGLPGKSGVGGGILVIAPGRASIAVWSPGLDLYGNSKLGTLAMESFVHETGWSIFG